MLEATEVIQVEIEGAVRVFTLGEATSHQPPTYGVSFAPYAGGSDGVRIDKRAGLADLEGQLRAIGILDEFIETALDDVKKTGRAVIPRVRLTLGEIAGLGF